MTKPDTDKSREYAARNKVLMNMIGLGRSQKEIAASLGMTVGAVASVVLRAKRAPAPLFVSVRGPNSTDRSHKQRALDAAGVIHAKGHILGKDHEAFKAMVKRALPAVQRATKGETE